MLEDAPSLLLVLLVAAELDWAAGVVLLDTLLPLPSFQMLHVADADADADAVALTVSVVPLYWLSEVVTSTN